MPDLLVIGQEGWGPVERRNQLLVRALAARNPHSRFLFVEQPLRPRQVRRWRWPRVRRVAANIWVLTPLRPIADSLSRRLGDRLECRQIGLAASELALERPIVWSQNPRLATLVDRLPGDGLIYDLTDDWAAFEADMGRRSTVSAQISSLVRRADLVFACSRILERQACQSSRQVTYLPNAVDGMPSGGSDADSLPSIPRPRLGYSGTLHAARIDVSLLIAAAKLRPNWSFVFLGPDLLDAAESRRLFEPANVHHLGVLPHREVAAHISSFDVCLLPNVVTNFTRSLDPLKLYEYLAAGRPVVATPAGIPDELSPYIATAATAEELVEEAERLLSEDGEGQVAARRASVAGATWERRAAAIEAALGIQTAADEPPDVSAVVVNFNTRDLLARCLSSLADQEGIEIQTIVVDNASSDGSRDMIRNRFPGAEVVELAENVGFARANNIAFEQCRGRFILLLNSDAFVHPGALRELLSVASRHPSAAAIGPRLLNPDGTLQRSAWPFPRAARLMLEALGLHRLLRAVRLLEDLGTWEHDEERAVEFLIGACLLLRAEALLEVTGFDEAFWIYGEEADLQRRLAGRGWSSVLAPGALVTHVGGASSSEGSRERLRHFYSGQRRFLHKHGPPYAWPVARLALLLGSVLRGRWSAARVALELR